MEHRLSSGDLATQTAPDHDPRAPSQAAIPQPTEHGYVAPDYLQATAALVAPFKARSYEQMHLREGQHILDVGCGVGIDVFKLAEQVGTTGFARGVDADADMLQQARQRVSDAGMTNVAFELAGADALPCDDGSIDAVRSERMLQHLANPGLALAEMLRVTRAGGRIVLLDTDWGSLSINIANAGLERRITAFKAEHALRNGFSGRRLFGLLRNLGLIELSIEVLPLHSTDGLTARFACALDDLAERALQAGVITQREFDEFTQHMLASDLAGDFFASVNMVLVAGTKP